MAKICVVIEVPHKTTEELRQFVHDVEAEYDDTPVAVDYVKPLEIVAFAFTHVGHLGSPGYNIVYQSMED